MPGRSLIAFCLDSALYFACILLGGYLHSARILLAFYMHSACNHHAFSHGLMFPHADLRGGRNPSPTAAHPRKAQCVFGNTIAASSNKALPQGCVADSASAGSVGNSRRRDASATRCNSRARRAFDGCTWHSTRYCFRVSY